MEMLGHDCANINKLAKEVTNLVTRWPIMTVDWWKSEKMLSDSTTTGLTVKIDH